MATLIGSSIEEWGPNLVGPLIHSVDALEDYLVVMVSPSPSANLDNWQVAYSTDGFNFTDVIEDAAEDVTTGSNKTTMVTDGTDFHCIKYDGADDTIYGHVFLPASNSWRAAGKTTVQTFANIAFGSGTVQMYLFSPTGGEIYIVGDVDGDKVMGTNYRRTGVIYDTSKTMDTTEWDTQVPVPDSLVDQQQQGDQFLKLAEMFGGVEWGNTTSENVQRNIVMALHDTDSSNNTACVTFSSISDAYSSGILEPGSAPAIETALMDTDLHWKYGQGCHAPSRTSNSDQKTFPMFPTVQISGNYYNATDDKLLFLTPASAPSGYDIDSTTDGEITVEPDSNVYPAVGWVRIKGNNTANVQALLFFIYQTDQIAFDAGLWAIPFGADWDGSTFSNNTKPAKLITRWATFQHSLSQITFAKVFKVNGVHRLVIFEEHESGINDAVSVYAFALSNIDYREKRQSLMARNLRHNLAR